MSRRWAILLMAFLAPMLISTGYCQPDPAALRAWVGIYPHDQIRGRTFLDDPDILIGIIGALGSGAVPQIKKMTTVGPIVERGDWIIAYGCQPHMCSDAKWWVAINFVSLETRACLALLDSPTIRLGASGKEYADLPRSRGDSCPEPEKAIPIFDALIGASRTVEQFNPPARQSSANKNLIRVPLKKDGGTFGVPVEINGALTLDFIVDSGAADVSIPSDVFLTLIRAGTIQDTDVTGEQIYVLADGSKSKAVTFTIKSLKVADTIVQNVRGSVAAPQGVLLLGQSFLGRFKSWSVDNARHELVLERQ
jgi:clan AA aspartic protease (TIGR02281 family)